MGRICCQSPHLFEHPVDVFLGKIVAPRKKRPVPERQGPGSAPASDKPASPQRALRSSWDRPARRPVLLSRSPGSAEVAPQGVEVSLG